MLTRLERCLRSPECRRELFRVTPVNVFLGWLFSVMLTFSMDDYKTTSRFIMHAFSFSTA